MMLSRIMRGGRWRWVCGLVAMGCARAAMGLTIAVLLRHVLGHSGEVPSAESPGARWFRVVLLFLMAAAVYGLRIWEGQWGELLGQSYVLGLRRRWFSRLLASGAKAHGRVVGGATVGRMTNDLSAVRNWVSRGYARVWTSVAVLACVLPVLFARQPRLIPFVALVAVAWACLGMRLARALARSDRVARTDRGRLANRVAERVNAAAVARGFGREQAEIRGLQRLGKILRFRQVRRAVFVSAMRHLADPIPVLLMGTLAMGLPTAAGGPPSAGEVGFLWVLLGLVGLALRDLCHAWEQKVIHREACRRWRRWDDHRAPDPTGDHPVESTASLEAPTAPVTRHLPPADPPLLRFERVSWGHVFSDLEIRLDRGKRAAVVGPGASGKSVLLGLAAGWFVPGSGRVSVAGAAPHELSGKRLRCRVQWIAPQVPLLEGTVSSNLRYGLDAPDPVWTVEVAAWCGLLRASSAFPRGLQTPVGMRGAGLSAGARARLALARAILVKPRLLLVDDPAFVLDPEALEALQRVMNQWKAAMLWVADGRSLPPCIDQVWTLMDGRVRVESAASRIATRVSDDAPEIQAGAGCLWS